MTVQEIYERYRILPSLQLHQLRVAAVGKLVCENSMLELDTESVVLAGLFHDMGNIIKSDLTLFPEFVEPEGIGHWQLVKEDFLAHYGSDEHEATAQIVREIGLPEQVCTLIDHIGFSKMEWIRDEASHEQQAAEYGDLRVAPHGIVSLTARLEESKRRYASKHSTIPRTEETYERLATAAHDIERMLFADSAIAPDDITEESAQALFAQFRDQTVA